MGGPSWYLGVEPPTDPPDPPGSDDDRRDDEPDDFNERRCQDD